MKLNPGMNEVGAVNLGKEEPPENASISGGCFDEETGDTLTGVSVSVYQDDKFVIGTVTDGNGWFQVENLVPDEGYRITFTLAGYQPVVFE